jgi:thiazole synthase
MPDHFTDEPLRIGGREIRNRFFLGTGKFGSRKLMADAIAACGAEVVTIALRRAEPMSGTGSLLDFIPPGVVRMVNTSGARNAGEAVRMARLAREAGMGNWIKVEVIDDGKYLLPDNAETIRATEILAGEGFVVLPYMYPDLYAARNLVRAGAAALMPLGSLIGSGRGLKTADFIAIMLAETDLPVIVDAGIGRPSHAAGAMEMGAAAVLANTAVAAARDPVRAARAFALAVEAGRDAFLAGLLEGRAEASASSPLDRIPFER